MYSLGPCRGITQISKREVANGCSTFVALSSCSGCGLRRWTGDDQGWRRACLQSPTELIFGRHNHRTSLHGEGLALLLCLASSRWWVWAQP